MGEGGRGSWIRVWWNSDEETQSRVRNDLVESKISSNGQPVRAPRW